jgi:hypothetical protein
MKMINDSNSFIKIVISVLYADSPLLKYLDIPHQSSDIAALEIGIREGHPEKWGL